MKFFFKKGNVPKNKGKITIRKCDFCSYEGQDVFLSREFQHLLCDKHFYHFKTHGKILWGDEKPYKTPEPRRTRHTLKGIIWRKSVYKRDNYTCQECRIRGVKLEADHIKPFKYFPELRYLLSNGRTLCKPCHMKTDTWGRRGQKLYADKIK